MYAGPEDIGDIRNSRKVYVYRRRAKALTNCLRDILFSMIHLWDTSTI